MDPGTLLVGVGLIVLFVLFILPFIFAYSYNQRKREMLDDPSKAEIRWWGIGNPPLEERFIDLDDQQTSIVREMMELKDAILKLKDRKSHDVLSEDGKEYLERLEDKYSSLKDEINRTLSEHAFDTIRTSEGLVVSEVEPMPDDICDKISGEEVD